MGACLMGVETEYALCALDRNGRRCDPAPVACRLMEAACRAPHLMSSDGQGLFLANGGKLYIDIGSHPEFATPEVTNPWDIVRYVRAGDLIISRLLSAPAAGQVTMFRGNIGYGGEPTTWACHESYLTRSAPASFQKQLIPFLVSRILYCGSGGFNAFSPGLEFQISPRAAFLTTIASNESTQCRPIFHLRDEPLAGPGYRRLHILCGDSLGSEAGMWLRSGVTALVVRLIDAGLRPAEEVELSHPLAALKTYAADPSCTAAAQSVRGAALTAIAIQRRYLAHAEARLQEDLFPAWAPRVVESWRRFLDILETDPSSVEPVLDWAIKLSVYAGFCRKRGVAWESLRDWTHVVQKLREAHTRAGISRSELTPETLCRPDSPVANDVAKLTRFLRERNLDWQDLPRFLKLRNELLEIDTRFLQLGSGLFETMEREGVLEHQVLPGREFIEEAVGAPPSEGRASVRGACVKQFSGGRSFVCGWSGILDQEARSTN